MVLDYEDDADFITMLTNPAEQDEMVLQCLGESYQVFITKKSHILVLLNQTTSNQQHTKQS